MTKLRVGMIGIRPGASWGATAHLPALRALPDTYEVVGVANSTLDSSQQAAAATGIPRAFASPDDLIADPAIDLVVITVKVPAHRALAEAAIAAGKAVWCEWPLTIGLNDADRLSAAAAARSARTVVGLQGRFSPVVRHFGALLADGYVGRILSASVIASAYQWGATTDRANAYLADVRAGATMLAIAGGHLLDTIGAAMGPVVPRQALLTRRRDVVAIAGTPDHVALTVPDQLVLAATVHDGAPLSLHLRGGMARATNLLWEVNGTEGDLRITGDVGHPQFATLSLEGARGSERSLHTLDVPADDLDALGPRAGNVARLYRAFAAGEPVPDFTAACDVHRLLATIEALAG